VHAGHGSPGAPDPRYDFALTDENFPLLLQGQPSFAASPSLNQLDFFGYWKVLDALVQSLPRGSLPSIVFDPNNQAALYLGTWPDGTPYKPMRREDLCGK